MVHSSNLCTEITLNTSVEETAVCNLGSVNLVPHLTADGLDAALIRDTVKTAVRMLDNVIDVNHYTTPESRRANQRHRPVGLGLMGFADALLALLYRAAWRHGLKTTYYLRSQSATHVEKSTLQGTDGRLNAVPVTPAAAVCPIEGPECEACQ